MKPILTWLLVTLVSITSWAQPIPDSISGRPKPAHGKDTAVFPRTDSLRQVTVVAAKNGLQVENGRIVMNLTNSALTTGSSVFDILKKMPGISISQDDNISMRGTEGVNVLIDGKMNYLSGKQLSDFLKAMGADNIVRIELITSPTAEFDAAGNAGLINIVTRKRNSRGYAIDLRSGITRASTWMVNENITASINTSRLSLLASFDYNTPNRQLTSKSSNDVTENNNQYRLERTNTSLYRIKFYTYRLGADWRITDRHQLSASYHGYFDDFMAPKAATVGKYDERQALRSFVQTQNNIVEPYYYNAFNLAHTWSFDSTGKKLTTEVHYISYRNLSDALMTSENKDAVSGMVTEENALRSHQPGYITIRSAKTDLEWPHQAFLIKAGLKYAYVSNDNNYRFDSLIAGSFKEAASMSNHFLYKEKIAAAYLSVSKKIKRTSVLAGLRVEHTDAKGYTVKDGFTNSWAYMSFFPSLSIDQELKQHKFNLSLSRRINRPTYADLNPVRWYTDQYFYYAGNPALVPEMAWLLSAAWTFHRKYILTATYGYRDNYITKRLSVDSAAQAVKSQTANFSHLQRLDLLLSAPFNLGIWSLQASAGVNYSRYPFPQVKGDATASRWAANMQLQQQWKLSGGFKLELAAFFYSRELWGIYLKDELFFADAGIRKSFFKDNLTLQLNFTDFLRTYRLQGASQSDATNYQYYDRPDAHRIGFSIRYHIGGKLVPRRTNSIEEQERL